jgi:hypothetical protein
MKRILILLLILPVLAHAAPKAELWPVWQAHDNSNHGTIDHVAWDEFLHAYVKPSADGINRVAYSKVSVADKVKLEKYLLTLQNLRIGQYAQTEQRAYWINLYNATTVKTILDHYPVESITKINISPGLFARGPWGKKQLKVEGAEVALDDIEHRILRPLWNDPRTHYSVNCASLGCPNLAAQAYTAANMEALLDAGARAYVNHPRGATVDSGKLVVSSIYAWFKDDFGGDDAGVIAHLKQYAAPKLAAQLNGITRISDDRYDWTLNDVK